MRSTTAITRGPEMIHLGFSTITAIGLVLLTTACGDKTDEGGKLFDVVSAAEIASPVAPATITPVSTTPVVSENVTFAEAESVFAAKRYGEATEMFAVIAARRPETAWGHYMHGLSAWKAGNRERAESAFLVAIERDSNHVKSRLNLARVLLDGGRAGEALPHVEKALLVDSTSVDGYRLLGRVKGELKEIEPAVVAYRKAISLNERDVWSMNNLGFLLIRNDRFEEAIGPLALASSLEPGTAVFQNNLGMALERTGRFTLAAEAYRAALTADSGYAKATVSLARVEGRKEDPSMVAIDLPTAAQSFAASVRPTTEASVVMIPPPIDR